MVTNETTALKVAELLLQIKAIVLQPDNPFTWASGWNSPIYCDNRKTLSFPQIRTYLRQELVTAISDNFGTPDVIAGVATGGIAQGALVAQQLGVPFVYVRSSPKGHGLTNLIEGVLNPEQSVVVIEDLISTGGSSLKAVDAIREVGSKVLGMASIFSYDFEIAKQNFKKSKCDLTTLSDYNYLIKNAVESGYIDADCLTSLQEWRESPQEWKK
ncbi:MAG: orotate phosphoribosyltransferase [Flavobacteriales bacterium]|nr:orotate phosphoribosyltransferase [Flavobacteriales bacterium]